MTLIYELLNLHLHTASNLEILLRLCVPVLTLP